MVKADHNKRSKRHVWMAAMRRSSLYCAAAIVVAGLALVPASAARPAGAVITAVTISGHTTHGRFDDPTITIKGSDFGAAPRTACSAPSHGGTGCNYGDGLWLWALGPHGVGSATTFRAGRVGMAGRVYEVDSIGLIVTSYNNRHISFRLGSAYNHSPGYHWSMSRGDVYKIRVNGTTYQGRVPAM